jgi:hypothetical protein
MKPVLTFGVLLAACLTGGADDAKDKESSAASLLAGGVAKAKEHNKPVFLLFGSPG